jgi:hypothetical protein
MVVGFLLICLGALLGMVGLIWLVLLIPGMINLFVRAFFNAFR